MLLIERKNNESVVIVSPNGEKIKIKMLPARGGNRKKIAINASEEFKIYREEVYEAKRKANEVSFAKPAIDLKS